MVVPKKHIPDLESLEQEELTDFFSLVRSSAITLKKAIKPEGLNIGANLGKAAGAGIAEHLHFHIVPRWDGDHNFMPVIGNTMVIPEQIKKTYEKLLPYFE